MYADGGHSSVLLRADLTLSIFLYCCWRVSYSSSMLSMSRCSWSKKVSSCRVGLVFTAIDLIFVSKSFLLMRRFLMSLYIANARG